MHLGRVKSKRELGEGCGENKEHSRNILSPAVILNIEFVQANGVAFHPLFQFTWLSTRSLSNTL